MTCAAQREFQELLKDIESPEERIGVIPPTKKEKYISIGAPVTFVAGWRGDGSEIIEEGKVSGYFRSGVVIVTQDELAGVDIPELRVISIGRGGRGHA